MVVWAQRRRLPGGAPKELPDELRGLDTQQKAALDKLVHGEQFDVKLGMDALAVGDEFSIHKLVPGGGGDGGGSGGGGGGDGEGGGEGGGGGGGESGGGGGGVSSGPPRPPPDAQDARSREFLSYNVQLRTLRWGWQAALDVDSRPRTCCTPTPCTSH